MIALDRLVACALGEDDDEVEAHVLACDECAARFAELASLPAALRERVRAGGALMVVSPLLLDHLEAAGLVSRRYVLAPGGTVPCTVSASDVYSLVTLEAELAGASRVDLVRTGGRFTDIPFDSRAGRVYLVTPSAYVRTLPTAPIPFRLVAVERDGDRTLGEYTLDHTAFEVGSPP